MLKGQHGLRTAVHEAWHAHQWQANRPFYDYWVGRGPDITNPLELTQPLRTAVDAAPYIGAYNFEWQTLPPAPSVAGYAVGSANNATSE